MIMMQLVDANSGVTYSLKVSEEDAEKANTDLTFATKLLQIAKDLEAERILQSGLSFANDDFLTERLLEETLDNPGVSTENNVFHWPHEAILLLISIYMEEEHQIKSGKISMKKFWNIISSKLKEKGYNVTDVQCKSKMNGLKNTYKNVKDHNAKSGNNQKKWQYFDVMDKNFNDKPWVSPVLTLDSNKPSPMSDVTNITCGKRDLSPSKHEKPSKRIKQYTLLEKLITVTEENTTQRQKIHEESIVRQDRLLDILNKLVNK